MSKKLFLNVNANEFSPTAESKVSQIDSISGSGYTKQFIGTIEMNRLFSDYSKNNNNINSFKDFQSLILNEG